jgi:hypothetical protein
MAKYVLQDFRTVLPHSYGIAGNGIRIVERDQFTRMITVC